MVTESLNTN